MTEEFQIKLKYLSNTTRKDLGEFTLHQIHDETMLFEELKSIFEKKGFKFIYNISQFFLMQNSEMIPFSIEKLAAAETILLSSAVAPQCGVGIACIHGAIIQMYHPAHDHNPPHFHAYYNEYEAVFTINPIALIKGKLPQNIKKEVTKWAKTNQVQLSQMWDEQKIFKL